MFMDRSIATSILTAALLCATSAAGQSPSSRQTMPTFAGQPSAPSEARPQFAAASEPDSRLAKRLIQEALNVLPSEHRVPIDAFVFVYDFDELGKRDPTLTPAILAYIRSGDMFVRGDRLPIYVNTTCRMFQEAQKFWEEADPYERQHSPYRYLLAVEIAHEKAHTDGRPRREAAKVGLAVWEAFLIQRRLDKYPKDYVAFWTRHFRDLVIHPEPDERDLQPQALSK